MPPKYRLTFFAARGLGEGSRYLFAAAGVEYEDRRFTYQEWPDIQPTTPMGFVPVLEVDGVELTQSRAIERYLAKEFGLAGKNHLDQARVDMAIDTITEGYTPGFAIFREKDPVKKEAMKKHQIEVKLPDVLARLEKIAPEDGHFVGGELTWADTAFLHLTGMTDVNALTFPSLAPYPKLQKIKANVEAHPGIAAWIKARPVTAV